MEGEVPKKEEGPTRPEDMMPAIPAPEGEVSQAPAQEGAAPEAGAEQGGTQLPETEAQEFDYEARKQEIESRFKERMEKYLAAVEEIFSKGNMYEANLENARRKTNALGPDRLPLASKENLALLLNEKSIEINEEKSEAMSALSQKKNELDEKRHKETIAEI